MTDYTPSPPADSEDDVPPTASIDTSGLMNRLLRLPEMDRLEIASSLLESIRNSEEFQLSSEQRAELSRRLRTPGRSRPVEEFLAELDARYG